MTKTFSAIFENGVLRPLEPVCLPEHCQVQVELREVQSPPVATQAPDEHAGAPIPQRVRLVGKLAMDHSGARRFNLLLDDGHHCQIEWVAGDLAAATGLLNQRVLVLGTAIFRSSGDLIRVEADDIGPAHAESSFFYTMPRPTLQQADVDEALRDRDHKGGVSSIIGQWPGDETDEEIASALKELS